MPLQDDLELERFEEHEPLAPVCLGGCELEGEVCGGPGAGAGGVSRYPKLLFNIRSMVRRVLLCGVSRNSYEDPAARPGAIPHFNAIG